MHLTEQFVPQDVCLSCDGCCRFKEKDSVWRPRMLKEEVEIATRQGLAEVIFSQNIDDEGRIKTTSCGQGHLCSFFEASDNSCRVYAARPFECQLYPFILTKKNNRPVLSVHLNCPFVQEKRSSSEFDDYVDYLKNYFSTEEARHFLRKNPVLFALYPDYEHELEVVFDLGENKTAYLFDQKDLIEEYLEKETHHLSSFSFVNIFLWKDFFSFSVEKINGLLCVFAEHESGTFLYLPPLGPGNKSETLKECFRLLRERNSNPDVSRIENLEDRDLVYFSTDEFDLYKKSYEFCYYKEDIISFSGNAFKSKRSSYNQFSKNYEYEYLPFEKNMAKECLELYEDWSSTRAKKNDDDIYRHMLHENRSVHALGMEFFRELGLVGRVVLVDGKIQAYTFGYRLNNQEFCVLFEITNLKIDGLSVFIFNQFCSDPALQSFAFINVMDDFELKNIESVKMSFRPTLLFPSYTGKIRNRPNK